MLAVFVAALAPLSCLAQQTQVDVYQGGRFVRSVVFVVGLKEYFVNGQVPGVKMDAAPFIDKASGRTFVPIRYLAYGLGVAAKDLGWQEKARKVTLKLEDRTAELAVGSKTMKASGQAKTMDVAPQLKSGRTYLPARWVAEALGYEIGYERVKTAEGKEKELVYCWPKGEKKPETDINWVKQYVSPPKDDEELAKKLYDAARPYQGQPLDHGQFKRESRLVQRAREISFITPGDLPARVGSHVIRSIDFSELLTLNRIKTEQVALGSTKGGGYVTPADLIFWEANGEALLERPGAAPHKTHLFTAYYPLGYLKPGEVKYFVFHSDCQLLAVKNPHYEGE
jgi:hypothetical protein